MTNEQRFKQCLEWILENIHKPFVDTSTIEHHIIHELHLARLEDAKREHPRKEVNGLSTGVLPTVTIDVDYLGNKYPLKFYLFTPNASHTMVDGRSEIWYQMTQNGLSREEADELSSKMANEALAKVKAQVRNGEGIK